MNTISRGDLYSFNDTYSIYRLTTNDLQIYYLSIPNKNIDNCVLYLTFPTEDTSLFDKTKTINEIDKYAKAVHQINPNGLYLFCNLPFNELHEASNDNDNKLYDILLNKLHIITKDAYDAISLNNDITISPQIYAIKDNSDNTKFIDWLELKLNGFIVPIDGKQLIKGKIKTDLIEDTGNSDFGTKGFGGDGISNTKSDSKIKKLVKPRRGQNGFGSFSFISLIIAMSLIYGVGVAYLLIK